MNKVFFILVASAFAAAAWSEISAGAGAMEALTAATLKAAEGAVPLALGLAGIMAFFLGLMKVAEESGLVDAIGRLIAPLMRKLFPEVPAGHPAMGAMTMNVAANLLGLGNAATPFGIRAMEHLESLNRRKGRASDSQVLFLALNTASVTLLPTSVVALRASAGSADPAAVIAPTLAATLTSAAAAVLAAKLLAPLAPLGPEDPPAPDQPPATSDMPVFRPAPSWASAAAALAVLALIPAAALWGKTFGHWIVPGLAFALLGWGLIKGVRIYESFVAGAREGVDVALRIIPYLVAVLAAIAMVRSAGVLDAVMTPLSALTAPLGAPAEALTMAAMRSLSGSGSFGLLASYMNDPAVGPDGALGVLLGTIYGSSETTFYVLAVYFGAVGIKRMRHALAAGLIADAVGLAAAVLWCAVLLP